MLQDQIEAYQEEVLEQIPPALEVTADFVVQAIRTRSLSGQGLDGPFAPCAESTVQQKGTTHVTLEESGAMHEALTHDADGLFSRVVHYADSESERKASAHKRGAGRLPKRDEFGVTEPEAEHASTIFSDRVTAGLPTQYPTLKVELVLFSS